MKKLLAVVVAIALVCSLSVVAFAETELYNLTNRSSDTNDVLADGFTVSGWCPSLITEYKYPDVMAAFKTAIQTEGAKIEVTTSGPINGILLQSYPLEGGSNYPHIIYNEFESSEVDGRTVSVFDAAGFIAAYTSTDHTDDPSVKLSMDNVLNFAVDASEGTVIYAVRVITDDAADPAPAESGDVETEPETPADTAEPETPAETGIVLAVLPVAVAAAAVVVSKKRK